MQKANKTTIHLNIDKTVLENFDLCFPHARTRFVENAFKLACDNRMLFERIFFQELLIDKCNNI